MLHEQQYGVKGEVGEERMVDISGIATEVPEDGSYISGIATEVPL